MGRRRESRGEGDFMKERGVRRLFVVCPRSGHTAKFFLPCVQIWGTRQTYFLPCVCFFTVYFVLWHTVNVVFAVCLVFAVCFFVDTRQTVCLPCVRNVAHGKQKGTRQTSIFR